MRTLAIILFVTWSILGCSKQSDQFTLSGNTVVGNGSQAQMTLTYPQSTFYAVVGENFSTTPTLSTVGIYVSGVTYTIDPALPSSFSIDQNTGVISGVPTFYQTNVSYIITATKGQYSTTVLITLNFVAPMGTPAYEYSNLEFAIGSTTTYAPNSNASAISYRSVPTTLPSGITLNSTTGVITGTPTQISSVGENTSYTIYAKDQNNLEKSVVVQLTRVYPLTLNLTQSPLQTLAITGGSSISMPLYYIGGRGTKTYQVLAGGGSITTSGTYTPPTNSGAKTVRITDLNGVGSYIDLSFNVDYPALSVANASIANPSSGSVVLNFTVALNGYSNSTTSFSYQTLNGNDPSCAQVGSSATGGVDYSSLSGSDTISPYTSNKTVPVTIYSASTSQTKYFCLVVTPVGGGTSSVTPITVTGGITP